MSSTNNKIKPGFVFETTFYSNNNHENPYRFKANHIDKQRAPKVILCDDNHIQVGQPCKVRVTSVKSPQKKDRGFIEVEFLSAVTFKIDESFFIDEMLSLKLQALIETGRNILLDGPQGSGKTVLSRKVAEALGMDYVFFNCSSVYEATDFLATLQIKATESGQAETVWTPTDIMRALESALENPRQRYLIFLDEFNRCREMARNGIMPALDSTRKMYNPLTGSTVDIPDNICWIAAINNGSQFTGTTSVDPAQLDRFAPLKMNYPPEAAEVKILLQRFPSLETSAVKRVVKAANAVRSDEELAVDLSMRATEEACALLSHPNFSDFSGDPLPEILKSSFSARFMGDGDDASTDAGLVWRCIQRSLNK